MSMVDLTGNCGMYGEEMKHMEGVKCFYRRSRAYIIVKGDVTECHEFEEERH